MKKQFLGNLALLQGLNLLVKPLWILGIDRAVQNTLPHSEYGIYFTLNNLCLLFGILLDLGITSYNNRTLAQNNSLLPGYFARFTRLKMLLSLVYLAFITAVFFILGYSQALLPLLLLLACNQVLTSYNQYLRSNLSALHYFKTDSFISVLDRLVSIITCSLLLWYALVDTFSIWWFVACQTFGLLVALATSFLLVWGKMHKAGNKSAPAQVSLRRLLRESLPYAVLATLMTFYTRIDGVLLERLLPDGAEQAARYASGFRLLDAVNMFAVLISGLLLPMFSRMLARRESVTELAWLSSKLLLLPAIALVSVTTFFNQEIMGLMYADFGSGDPVVVFSLLMASFIPFCAIYVFGTLVTAMGHIRQLNLYAVLTLAVNIGLNLLLIPQLHAKGAAISTLTTQTVFAFLCFLESRHHLHLRSHVPVVAKMLATGLACGLAAFACSRYGAPWYLACLVVGAVCILLSLLLKLFYLPNIIGMLRSNNA